ncbi:hypothetical protein LSAT2_032208 [Lamellibrachia satsuma]|nr:hypothetical protein LSAT2_032208 [Lamellibrachia satsuma]
MAWPCYVNRYAHLSVSGCLRLLANNLNSERTCLKRLLCQKSEIRKISARNMATTVTAAAYGGWKSPITSELATKSSVSFQELHVDKAQGNQGAVYWSELRFDEGGRIVICSRTKDEADITQWTPKDFNARTRVHEYGGGAFFVHDSAVYFSNFVDQRLYIQKSASDLPQPLTLENCGWRCGSELSQFTSRKLATEENPTCKPFSINHHAVLAAKEGALCQTGLVRLTSLMNIRGSLHHKSFTAISTNHITLSTACTKRCTGHGVGFVIEMLTGLFLDYALLCKYCIDCELVGKKLSG